MSRADEAAFPFPSFQGPNAVEWGSPGMSIREHFAAMAMQGIIGTSAGPCLTGFDGCEPNIAAIAVGMADALLAELAKPVTEPQTSSYRERVARAVVSAATGLSFTSDADVPVEISSGELKQLVRIAMEQITP